MFCCALLAAASCRTPARPGIEDLAGREDLSRFRLATLRGARDGDRLNVAAMFSDSSSMLTLSLRVVIAPPASTLESGAWKWARNNRLETGAVRARSVTFLGGQSGSPSLGGTFDLLASSGEPRYRVTMPVTETRPLAARP